MRPWIVLRAALVASLVSVAAAAQGAPRVAYEAPEGCPSAEAFVAMLRTRGVEVRASTPALSVAVQRREEGFAGALRVGDAAAGPREVSGAKCAEVVDALAAVAALALRPVPVAPEPVERPVSPPPELVLDREMVLSLSGGVASGFLPGRPVGRVELSLERNNLAGLTGGPPRLVVPSLRISLGLLGGGDYRWGTNTVDVSAQYISLGGCTHLLYAPEGLSASVCSQVSAGLAGVSTTSADGRKADKLSSWGALGADLRLRYGIGSRFHLALGLGGDVRIGPLEAEDPDGHRRSIGSPLSFHGQLGAGLRF